MSTDTTRPTRRVTTRRRVRMKQKRMQANAWFAAALLVAATLSGPAATAADGELLCTHGSSPEKGDSVACYSDAGCRYAASLGADPVRGYATDSAPFALARGKITGIVTASSGLITQIKKVGGSCRRL